MSKKLILMFSILAFCLGIHAADNRSSGIDKGKDSKLNVVKLDSLLVEERQQEKVTRQDIIALETLQKLMDAINSNNEVKIKNIFPGYDKSVAEGPATQKIFSDTLLFDDYSNFHIMLMVVKYYNTSKIVGEVIYSGVLKNKAGDGKVVKSVSSRFFTLKKEKNGWIINKFPMGSFEEDTFQQDKLMAKYKTNTIDDAYINKLIKEYLNPKLPPKTASFNGKTFYLAFASQTKGISSYLNEYLPKGESFSDFKNLIGIFYYCYPRITDPLEMIKIHLSGLQKQITDIPYVIFSTDNKNTYIFCFLTGAYNNNAKNQQKEYILEFNVFKWEYIPQKNIMVGVQYAYRHYGLLKPKMIQDTFSKFCTQLAIEMYYYPTPPEIYKSM